MLLSHNGKVSLPPEIILVIIESLEYEPGLFKTLKLISNDFRRLIEAYERSLSVHFAHRLRPIYSPLISSKSTSAPHCLHPRTLPWVDELYCRYQVTNGVHIQRIQLLTSLNRFSRNLAIKDLSSEYTTFEVSIRRLSVSLLYRIFDSRHNNSYSGYRAQEDTIRSMTTLDLAATILFLLAMSTYYTRCSKFKVYTIGAITEIQVAFRELVLRHGPYFIWIAMFGTAAEKDRVIKRVEKGVAQLRAFEESKAVGFDTVIPNPSLQGVIMREFCGKAHCIPDDCLRMAYLVIKHHWTQNGPLVD